ncbi:MAG: uncharacterized protein JWM07_576 [Candidatus Saccharibacteria bacterium]|nr:uncharacterized protein [Candidatus Saccharibacteria bacterium]
MAQSRPIGGAVMKGLVIGKFYPPHLGHSYLIDYALTRCDTVDVLVCDSPKYIIPAEQRREWLQAIHPKANVMIIPDLDDDDNSQAWAKHTIAFLGYAPDAVFSSENYGITYAALMNATHHMVDHDRTHVPISATKVRANIVREWRYLHPIIRAYLAIRIVIVGAESTGTTTLAQQIATTLCVPWVPEYGRQYNDGLLTYKHNWTNDDFVHIAAMQQQSERHYASISNGLIICDTNATATEVWQKRYRGQTTQTVHDIAKADKADLYIITGDEIPFVQDGTRDGEHIRHAMHKDFITHINATNVPYIVVKGNWQQRLAQALNTIKKMYDIAPPVAVTSTAALTSS